MKYRIRHSSMKELGEVEAVHAYEAAREALKEADVEHIPNVSCQKAMVFSEEAAGHIHAYDPSGTLRGTFELYTPENHNI